MVSKHQNKSSVFLSSLETETNLSLLQQSEAKFRALAETTHAIVFIKQGSHLCYVNPAAEDITGYCREELLSCPNVHSLIQECGEISCQQLEQKEKITHRQEIKILTKAGNDCWLDCAIGVIEFNEGLAIIGTATDITQQKQAEVKLQAALKRAHELSDLRAQFLRIISHELRSPLNDIEIAVSSLARYGNAWTKSKRARCFDGIQHSIEQLTSRLDEVLSISRARVFHTYSQAHPLNIRQFIDKTIEEIEQDDHVKHLFSVSFNAETDRVFVNQHLLKLIISNLLSNAVKYSAQGCPIDIHIESTINNLRFEIKDQGSGISEADQRHLFKPFIRGKNSENIPGLGLGLTIVKKLIDFYGGSITFTSKVGVGTAFQVSLPAKTSIL